MVSRSTAAMATLSINFKNQFKQTDNAGGSRENRLRFLIQVVDAVIEVDCADKVGVRLAHLSPSKT